MKWTRLAMGTGLTRSPVPHLHRDWAHPHHVCIRVGLAATTCAHRPGSRQQPPTSASGLRMCVPCRRLGAQVQPEGRAATAAGVHRCGPRGRASGMDARVDLARQPEIHDVRAAGWGQSHKGTTNRDGGTDYRDNGTDSRDNGAECRRLETKAASQCGERGLLLTLCLLSRKANDKRQMAALECQVGARCPGLLTKAAATPGAPGAALALPVAVLSFSVLPCQCRGLAPDERPRVRRGRGVRGLDGPAHWHDDPVEVALAGWVEAHCESTSSSHDSDGGHTELPIRHVSSRLRASGSRHLEAKQAMEVGLGQARVRVV